MVEGAGWFEGERIEFRGFEIMLKWAHTVFKKITSGSGRYDYLLEVVNAFKS